MDTFGILIGGIVLVIFVLVLSARNIKIGHFSNTTIIIISRDIDIETDVLSKEVDNGRSDKEHIEA